VKRIKAISTLDSQVTADAVRKALARGAVRRHRRVDVASSQLRERAGHYLDRVASGEMFRVLRRGRPVAMLIRSDIFQRLIEDFLDLQDNSVTTSYRHK